MRKLFTSFLSLAVASTLATAQVCTPNPNAIDVGDPGEIWPEEFDVVFNCTSLYQQVITAIVPPTLEVLPGIPATVNNYTINDVLNLPPGFTYACNPGSCVFVGSTTGCVLLAGNPTGVTPGLYDVIGDFTVSVTLPPFLGGSTVLVDTLYEFQLLVSGCTDCASTPLSAQAPRQPRSRLLPTSQRVEFKWGPVLNSIGYRISGGPIPALGTLPPQTGTFNTSRQIPYSQLAPGAVYRWGVQAGCGPTGPPVTPLSVFDTFASPTLRTAELNQSVQELRSLNLFPNPATDLIVLEYTSNEDSRAIMRVMDLNGRVVMTERPVFFAGQNIVRFDLNLAPGLYIMEVVQGNETTTARFTVTR
jgi:hypothetical protein